MTKEELDFLLAMLDAYEKGLPWNFDDPTTMRILKKFWHYAQEEDAHGPAR